MKESSRSSAPFAMTPVWVLILPISWPAKILYGILNGVGGGGKRKVFVGQKKLAKWCRVSVRTIKRYVQELRDSGLITVEPGLRRTSTYTLMEPENLDELKAMLPANLTDAEKNELVKGIKLGRKPKQYKPKKKAAKKTDDGAPVYSLIDELKKKRSELIG
jgi:DNA-binding transcriptional MocR family regulator